MRRREIQSANKSRREFLQQVGGATVAAIVGPSALLEASCGRAEAGRPADAVQKRDTQDLGFTPDVEIALRAVRSKAQLVPGSASDVWTFQGQVLRGPATSLVDVPSGALGPIFQVRRGQKLRVVFQNEIPEPTIVHWHGLHVPAAMDGHPRYAIGQGHLYVYEFEVRNQAGTYWYHAHPDMRTGPQVYRGMAGLFVVHDSSEDALPLPRDAFDLPLVIQDRSFDADNQLFYAPSPMDAMNGWLGDRVLVNGVGDYTRWIAPRVYRLRILNGSNSRIYRLAWADGTPLTVIGTDGGLLERPVERAYVMLGPAERLELWADFSGRAVGSDLRLVSLGFEGGGGMGMGPMRRVVQQGAPLPILTLKVDSTKKGNERLPLPAKLIPFERYQEADAINRQTPRRVLPTMQAMSWGINGRKFRLDKVAADEHAKLGMLEVWDFDNANAGMGGMGMQRGSGMGGMMGRGTMGGMGGMMGMTMPHPIHVHGGQFQVLRREGVAHAGYVDEGWKDTVLLMPGERAKILARYRILPLGATRDERVENCERETSEMQIHMTATRRLRRQIGRALVVGRPGFAQQFVDLAAREPATFG